MKKIYYFCDKCGAKLPAEQKIRIWVDRVADGAGSMENEYKTMDMCFNCLAKAVEKWFGKKGFVEGKQFYEEAIYEIVRKGAVSQ